MKSITHLLSSALKCALLAFVLFLSTSLHAQWQAYTPVISDTVGTFDLRIAPGDNQVSWSIAMKYAVAPDGYYPLYLDSIYYLKTADGGDTWNGGTLPMGPAPYASNISPVDGNTAWASGIDSNYVSYILHTDDGGATWTRQLEDGFTGASSYLNFVYFWDTLNGIAVGDPAESDTEPSSFYEIYTTSDGGQNWNRVGSDNIPEPLEDEFGSGGDYFVLGDDIWFPTLNINTFTWERVFHSSDRGASWSVSSPQCGLLSFADSLHGIGAAYTNPNFALQYTADGGATWINLPPIAGGFLTSLALIPESHLILAVVSNGGTDGPFRTIVSKNLGQTWTEIGASEVAGNAKFASPSIGYAGEWQPTNHLTRMYKYAGNPLVGLFSGLELDARVSLSPNPASDFLQVQIEVAEPIEFVLLLNDTQGRLIERKTIEKTTQANTRFDLGRLPAGMYTLTVSSEKGHLTRTVSKQ